MKRSLWSLLCFCYVACSSFATPPATPHEDPAGKRFRCHDLSDETICLSVLRPDCELSITREEKSDGDVVELVLPPEATQKLLLSCSATSREVRSPRDLVGFVSVEDASDALEFLRFFSSMWTAHLVEPMQMEIFVGSDEECFSSCLPPERWIELGLEITTVEELPNGFRVSRNVVRPIPDPLNVSAFRVVEDVLPDGAIERRTETPLHLELEDKARLTFHLYM